MRAIRIAVAGAVALTTTLLAIPATPAAGDAAGKSREAVIAEYQTVLLPALAVKNDWTGSVDGCIAGTTGPEYQAAVVTAVNYMRGLAGLGPVVLYAPWNGYSQAAALVMSAQNSLSHFPPPDWKCWSREAATGAGISNLSLGSAGASAVVSYVRDNGANNTPAGHRHSVLHPNAAAVSTGDTLRTNALLVSVAQGRQPSTQWVAWPTAGFFPWQLEPRGRWSLARSDADFSSASVSASSGGQPVPIPLAPVVYNRTGLTWDMTVPEWWTRLYRQDATVEITVSGIRLDDGTVTDYSYVVNLVEAAPRTVPPFEFIGRAVRNSQGILVTWHHQPTNTALVESYVVTAKPIGRKGKGLPIRTCTATVGSCQITGVARSVPYRISLVASNELGSSKPDVKLVLPGRT